MTPSEDDNRHAERLANERYRLLVESVSDYAILMLDADGRISSWNRGAERLKGYTEREILGQPYERFFTPESVDAGLPGRLLARARQEGHIEVEGWRQRKDGTRFWASAAITAMRGEDGVLLGYSKVTRDLTERKAAEDQRRQFELLVKSVSDYAILMLDPEGRITSWNRGAEHLKGYTEQEAIGRYNRIFYTPEDVAAGRPEQLLAAAAAEGHVEDEGWRVRKDGTRFWADVVLTAVYDEGALIGFAKITRDLTERKRMEELAARTAQLQASNRLKSEFMATMSHELRTPLNAIIGFTELVLLTSAGALDGVAVENLNTVLRNGRHLLALINEVLDLAKAEAGRATVNPKPFAPGPMAASAIDSTRSLAEPKGLAIELDVDPALDVVVADETKVRQILINLLSNAMKFTDAGGIRVAVAAAGPDAWSVAVSDTGPGIAAEHHGLVFEEFRQVDAGTTRAKGGTGLGLAISRKLAELLGGRLDLVSAPGEGATFRLELPRVFAAIGAPAGGAS